METEFRDGEKKKIKKVRTEFREGKGTDQGWGPNTLGGNNDQPRVHTRSQPMISTVNRKSLKGNREKGEQWYMDRCKTVKLTSQLLMTRRITCEEGRTHKRGERRV